MFKTQNKVYKEYECFNIVICCQISYTFSSIWLSYSKREYDFSTKSNQNEKKKQIKHLLCEYECICASPFTTWKLDDGVESDVNNIEFSRIIIIRKMRNIYAYT